MAESNPVLTRTVVDLIEKNGIRLIFLTIIRKYSVAAIIIFLAKALQDRAQYYREKGLTHQFDCITLAATQLEQVAQNYENAKQTETVHHVKI